MAYTFVFNILYLNLNSIFNISNAITTKYQFLAYKKNKILETDSRDFLKILTILGSFSYTLFSYKETRMSRSEEVIQCYIIKILCLRFQNCSLIPQLSELYQSFLNYAIAIFWQKFGLL